MGSKQAKFLPISHRTPSNTPFTQPQENSPRPSVHVPLLRHGFESHSSVSEKLIQKDIFYETVMNIEYILNVIYVFYKKETFPSNMTNLETPGFIDTRSPKPCSESQL